MTKFTNYEQASLAYKIVDNLIASGVDGLTYVNCSNKFTAKELITANGRTNTSLVGTSLVVTLNGLEVVVYDDSRRTKKDQLGIDALTNMLNDDSLPLNGDRTDLITSRIEPTGGDLFGINSNGEVKIRLEVKIGKTSPSSLPLNSYTSAGQAVYGEVPHVLVNGSIELSEDSLTAEERKIDMLMLELQKLGGIAAFEQKALEVQAKREATTFEQIPMVVLNTNTDTISYHTIDDTNIASRTVSHKMSTFTPPIEE